jgi:hypothetical protein
LRLSLQRWNSLNLSSTSSNPEFSQGCCDLIVVLAGSTFALRLKSWAQAVGLIYLRQGIVREPRAYEATRAGEISRCARDDRSTSTQSIGHFFFMKKVKILSASACESS